MPLSSVYFQVMTPVDLRNHDDPHHSFRLSNTFCLSRLPLPTRTEGTVPRLWAARRVMDDLKTSADTAVSRLLTHAFYTLLPADWAHALTQRSVLLPSSVLLANLAGPEAPIQVGSGLFIWSYNSAVGCVVFRS